MLRGFSDLHFPSPPQKELGSNASSQTHQVHFSSFRLNSRSSAKGQPASEHIGQRREHLRGSARFFSFGTRLFALTRVAQFAPHDFATCAARITVVNRIVTSLTSSPLRSSFRVLVNATWVSKTASTGSSVSREAKVQTPR